MEDSERDSLKGLIDALNGENTGKTLSDEDMKFIEKKRKIVIVEPNYKVLSKYFRFDGLINKEKFAAYPTLWKKVKVVCKKHGIKKHRANLYFILHKISWKHEDLKKSAEDDSLYAFEALKLYKLRDEIIREKGKSDLIDPLIKDLESTTNLSYDRIPKDIKNNLRKLKNPDLLIAKILNPLNAYLENVAQIDIQKARFEVIAQLLEIVENDKIIYDRKSLKEAAQSIKNKLK